MLFRKQRASENFPGSSSFRMVLKPFLLLQAVLIQGPTRQPPEDAPATHKCEDTKNAERRIPGLAGSLHRPKGASHFQHIQVPSEYLQIPPSWRAAECCSLATSIKLLTRAPWTISSHCRKSNLLFSSATASGWRRLPSPGTGWHHTPISTSGATLPWAGSSTPSRRWPVSTVLEAARPQCTWAIYICVCVVININIINNNRW